MIGERGLALTPAGNCCNPKCNRPLYAELMHSVMSFPDDEACFECNPPREELPTAFRLLKRANGGRLPKELNL